MHFETLGERRANASSEPRPFSAGGRGQQRQNCVTLGFSTAFLQMCPFWVVVLIKVSSSQRGYAVVFSEGAQFSQGTQQKFHFESDKWSSLGGHVSEVGRS